MPNSKADNPGIKFPPPVIYVLFAYAGAKLDNVISFSIGLTTPFNYWLTGIVVVVMVGFLIYMELLYKTKQTNPLPWAPTSNIIKNGPYAISRNPIYLVMTLIHLAAAFYYNSYWSLLMLIPAVPVINIFIKKEEKYLEEKFGDEYLAYKSGVRRWI